ncbi:fimbrial protein [Prevotella sp. HUN102]|uniref:fimbrial tip adhesin FimD n=1 Tax=Prevotella sp. HUN102 TaxID=1392486 RepID=UPI00048AA9BE|nr:fimbrial protein [Prevotella sp. HUN102]
MKISSYIYAAIASVFLLTLSACRAEDELPTIDKENSYQIQFGLSILPPQTRAVEPGIDDPLNENKITKMDAFLYDDAGVQQGHYSTEKGDLVVSNATAVSGTATIYVPKTSNLSGRYTGHDYHLYVLVNYHGTESLTGKTLDQLKAVKLTSVSLVQTPDIQPQADFLMDGTVKTGAMTWATSNNYTVGQTVKLSRAAAKIRIRLDTDIVIQDKEDTYEVVGAPTITLKSYTNQTNLLAGSPLATPQYKSMDDAQGQPMVQAEYNGKHFWARQTPYYSYENDWSYDGKVRTYAVIKLHVKGKNNKKDLDTYYSIPLNYLAVKDGMTKEEIAGMSKLQRNHLYDIQCRIKEFGSAEPTKPVDIPLGYIAIEDWNTPDAIDAAITKAHYLVVKELKPEMLNVNERLVEYISDLDIDVPKMNGTVEYEYTQYERNGSTTQIKGKGSEKNITIETITQGYKKYLKIKSPIPDNYVPLTIRFRVEQIKDPDDPTATPLWKDVEVTQYPPVYVTAKKSKGTEIYWYSTFTAWNNLGANGRGYQSNGTLFKVTTLAPLDGQIVGDPTFGTDRTDRGEEANKITSPQFIVASQWGMSTAVPQYSDSNNDLGWIQDSYNYEAATGKVDAYKTSGDYSYRYRNYSNAENRAYNYWEDDYGVSGNRTIQTLRQGYYWAEEKNLKFKYEGHWRIPTLAELALIVKIQKDPNSAVKSLLWGHQYWSAQTDMGYDFDNARNYPTNGTLSIRPVFDTYNKSE